MKIAIIGKGGSGKSSISWLLTNYFSQNKKVLAIDADYNMDLMHNFGIEEEKITFLKNAEKDMYDIFGLNLEENAFKITEKFQQEVFSIYPDDKFTKKYALDINQNLKLMVLGDHDQETMYSGRCSHAYAKSIKFYIPYLKTKKDQIVVIDSVAGTDMVNYGLYLGADLIISVVEDTKNSIMVMESAKKIASDFKIPFYCVLNKIQDSDLRNKNLDYVTKFHFDKALIDYEYEKASEKNITACQELENLIKKNEAKNNIGRLIDWRNKNQEYHK